MSDEKPKPSSSKGSAESNSASKSDTEKNVGGSSSSDNEDSTMEVIRKFFIEKLNLSAALEKDSGSGVKVIDDLSLDGIINHWKEKGFKNIITMVGAGISTSAGIPDFRSPGSGLYNNLQKYNLPYPSAIFEMDYFHNNPQPFFALAKELYPGTFNPTPAHYFVRMLHDKGLLLRHYTQNIDTLERIAGIPDSKLVEAHGTFYTNHCLGCRKLYSMEWMKDQIFGDHVPTCEKCNSVVKPDIVFFGENLPERFYSLPSADFERCDLLIIMGTSLEVQPFASLVNRPQKQCVRLLINRDKVGHDTDSFYSFFSGPGLLFDCAERNTRDVAYIGDCDDGVFALAEGLGWAKELRDFVKEEHIRLAKENNALRKTEKDLRNDAKRSDEKDATVASTSSAKPEKSSTSTTGASSSTADNSKKEEHAAQAPSPSVTK